MSLDGTTENDAGAPAQLSDADEAAHARDLAAAQMQRSVRRSTAPDQPQEKKASSADNDNNPFAQFVSDPPDNGVALLERQRLNRQEAFYRGSILGSSRLSMMANLFSTPDGPEVDPARKKVNDGLRDEYQGVVADLAAYDLMKPWGTTLEAATALGGQLEGSMLSPESWLGWGSRGATFLARTGKAALQQGAIQGVADPIVQGLGVNAGVQEGYDPLRTAAAAGLGALIGGGAHAAGEALGHVIGQGMLRRQLRDLANEDPSFLGIAPREEPEKPGPADATGTKTPEPEPEAPPPPAEATAEPQAPEPEPKPSETAPETTVAKTQPPDAQTQAKNIAQNLWDEGYPAQDIKSKMVKAGFKSEDVVAAIADVWEKHQAAEAAVDLVKQADEDKATELADTMGTQLGEIKTVDDIALAKKYNKPFEAAAADLPDQKVFDLVKQAQSNKTVAEAALAKVEQALAEPAAGPEEISGTWTKTGEQKGSNQGGVYRSPGPYGSDWYVKVPKSEEHVHNEILASKLYELAGVTVPHQKMVMVDGEPAVASLMLPPDHKPLGELHPGSLTEKTAIKSAQQHFAADAWLANHDVVGLNRDNLLVNPSMFSHEVTRIDQGGALQFRAQGEPKEGFGDKVIEFESMRDPKKAPQAASVFKGMSKKDLIDSINRVLMISDDEITDAVAKFGPTDSTNHELAEKLIARKNDLAAIREKLIGKTKPTDPSLPMDEKSRLTRAKALGFDTDQIWLHGTNATFDEFNLTHSKTEKAVFLTQEQSTANAFGGHANTLQLFTRAKKIKEVFEPVKPGDKYMGYNSSFFAKTIEDARKAGYDAVLFKQVADAGGTADQLAVLHPNLLRSIHAAFEPEKVKSSKLAAVEGKLPSKGFDDAAHEEMLREARNDTVEAAQRGEDVRPPTSAAPAPAKSLDERIDHLDAERASLNTEEYKGVQNVKVAEQKLPLANALSAATSPGVDGERWLATAKWALDNDRPDIAQVISERARKAADEPVGEPGVSTDSPRYQQAAQLLQEVKDEQVKLSSDLEQMVARAPGAGEPGKAPEPANVQAIAQRKKGQLLAMELQRQAAGTPQVPAVQGVAPPQSPQQQVAIRSLQQQTMDLAKALDFPVREGRVRLPKALATYNLETGVARTREIADFEAVSHEAGHAIEAKAGAELTNLINAHAAELGPLDYDYPAKSRPAEGFAEYVRYMLNNQYGQTAAPNFAAAFDQFMSANHPNILATLNKAGEARRAYNQAPSVDAVGAVLRSVHEGDTAFEAFRKEMKEKGAFPALWNTIKGVMRTGYDWFLDKNSDADRVVRALGTLIRDQSGGALVDLRAADNPAILLRSLNGAKQAAHIDTMYGMFPYQEVVPRGPALADAITLASGKPSVWGAWDPAKKKELSSYLIARRAEYLWRKYSAGELPNPPAAFSHGDAIQAMADLERANPNLRQASDMVHAYSRELLTKLHDSGILTGGADTFNKLMQEEFYVPFARDMSDKPMAGAGVGGGGAQGPGTVSLIKKMTGSSRDIYDPIESMMLQTLLAERTIRHNDIIRKFVDLAERAKGEGGRYVEPIPAHEAKKYTVNISEALEKRARELGMTPDDAKAMTSTLGFTMGESPIMGSYFQMEQAKPHGEPIVFYKDGGELKAARFISKDEGAGLYELLTASPQPVTDLWVHMISGAAAIKRSGIVTNPVFALANYVRDQVVVGLQRRGYIPFISGMSGLVDEFRQGSNAVMYAYSGGVAGGAAVGAIERAAEREVDAMAKKGYAVQRFGSIARVLTTGKGWTDAFKGLMEFASFSEAATRNSVFGKVFDAKRKQGLSPWEALTEAGYQARDILDFDRKGSRTQQIVSMLPFLNAHIQGLDKAARVELVPLLRRLTGGEVFTRDTEEFNNALHTMLKAGAIGPGLGAVWAAIMWEHEAYQDASPYFKGTHLVVPFGDKIAIVPKPFEMSLGFTGGEFAYARLMQDDPRAAKQFGEAAWQAVQPPNPWLDIPLVSTATELYLGKSLFTGRDIVPSTLQGRPAAQQYNENTSALAKWLGQITGMSPMKIDFGIGSQFGTWGRDLMALSQGVDQDTPARNWDDAVFTRRFIKDPTRSSDITTRFWDYMAEKNGKFQQDVAGYDTFIKEFDDAGAKKFLANLPAAERAFVTMKSAAKENGKAAFSADDKRLHPLQRALDAVTVLTGLRKELTTNTFRDFETLTRLKLDDYKRRDLLDNIRELGQMEMRNALVIMKEPGYETRPLLDPNDTMDKIVALSPEIGTEIASRYATSRIYTTVAVQKAWPQFRDELVRNGSEADIHGLAIDAKGEGYEFGGERAKRPQKRRVTIQPSTAAPAAP